VATFIVVSHTIHKGQKRAILSMNITFSEGKRSVSVAARMRANVKTLDVCGEELTDDVQRPFRKRLNKHFSQSAGAEQSKHAKHIRLSSR